MSSTSFTTYARGCVTWQRQLLPLSLADACAGMSSAPRDDLNTWAWSGPGDTRARKASSHVLLQADDDHKPREGRSPRHLSHLFRFRQLAPRSRWLKLFAQRCQQQRSTTLAEGAPRTPNGHFLYTDEKTRSNTSANSNNSDTYFR